MKAAIPLMMGLAGMLMNNPVKVPKIPSHKIETKKEVQQLSKRTIQKLKGKKARRNRGNNREDGRYRNGGKMETAKPNEQDGKQYYVEWLQRGDEINEHKIYELKEYSMKGPKK